MSDRPRPPSDRLSNPLPGEPRRTISGSMKLDLSKTLGTQPQVVEKGRQELEAAVSSNPPIPKAPEVPKIDEDVENRVSHVDPEEAAHDLQEGVGVFAASIDTITNALFLTIGKLHAITRRINIVIALALAAFLILAFAIFRIEGLIERLAEDRREALALKNDLVALKNDLQATRKEGQKTSEDVAAVKKASEEKPDISIVPDDKGGAKVVIKTSTAPTGVKLVPPIKKPPEEPAPPSIELPIQLPKGARVTDDAAVPKR